MVYLFKLNILVIKVKPPITSSIKSIQALLAKIHHFANNRRLALRASHHVFTSLTLEQVPQALANLRDCRSE